MQYIGKQNNMKKIIVFITVFVASSTGSCANNTVINKHENLTISNIVSDYHVTDLNNYDCKKINKAVLAHVLTTGIVITAPDLHDYYSSTGCSIQGTLHINSKKVNFSFDYGGYFRFSDGRILACGKACCTKDFENCSWDPEGLK